MGSLLEMVSVASGIEFLATHARAMGMAKAKVTRD
jgi:hypothetical protein